MSRDATLMLDLFYGVVVLIGIVTLWLNLAIAAAILAKSKGRGSFDWFILTLVMPAAIMPLLALGPRPVATPRGP
mgnify:CR=1 FL=1